VIWLNQNQLFFASSSSKEKHISNSKLLEQANAVYEGLTRSMWGRQMHCGQASSAQENFLLESFFQE